MASDEDSGEDYVVLGTRLQDEQESRAGQYRKEVRRSFALGRSVLNVTAPPWRRRVRRFVASAVDFGSAHTAPATRSLQSGFN